MTILIEGKSHTLELKKMSCKENINGKLTSMQDTEDESKDKMEQEMENIKVNLATVYYIQQQQQYLGITTVKN